MRNVGCLSVCSEEEWEFDSHAPRTEWGEANLPKLSLSFCANNPEVKHARIEVYDWYRRHSDATWRHSEADKGKGDITNPQHKDYHVRLNPLLCS
jgi:hypothetical protein